MKLISKRNFSFHTLRARKSGHYRFDDVHMEMPEKMSLKDVHKICDDIENEIEHKINNFEINIQVEPIIKDITKS